MLDFKSVVLIISITDRKFSLSYKPYMTCKLIDKVSIVRDKEYRSFVFFESFLKCFTGIIIKVICWFIEYQEIRRLPTKYAK